MIPNHLILCCLLLLLSSIFPSIGVFSNELALCKRWPRNWSYSFSISPSNEYSGLISFRIDGFDLLAVQGTGKVWDVLIMLSLGYHKVERRESNSFWRPIFLKFLLIWKFFQYCGWTRGTGGSEQTPLYCSSESRCRRTCVNKGIPYRITGIGEKLYRNALHMLKIQSPKIMVTSQVLILSFKIFSLSV